MADDSTLEFLKMVAEEATETSRRAWGYYEGAAAHERLADAGPAEWDQSLIPLNFTPEELTALASICSYYKHLNPYPSQETQKIATRVIERNRGY